MTAQELNSLPRRRKGPLLSTPMLQHGHMCTDMHIRTHACAHASTHLVHIKCVHTHSHKRTHMHTPHIDTQAQTHRQRCTHTHKCTHACTTYRHTYIYTQADIHTSTHTSTNTHTQTKMRTYTQTHSCTHTGKDTHIHTSTHTFSIPTEENYQSSTHFIF